MWFITDKGYGVDTKHIAAVTYANYQHFVVFVGKDLGVEISDEDAKKIHRIKKVEEGSYS